MSSRSGCRGAGEPAPQYRPARAAQSLARPRLRNRVARRRRATPVAAVRRWPNRPDRRKRSSELALRRESQATVPLQTYRSGQNVSRWDHGPVEESTDADLYLPRPHLPPIRCAGSTCRQQECSRPRDLHAFKSIHAIWRWDAAAGTIAMEVRWIARVRRVGPRFRRSSHRNRRAGRSEVITAHRRGCYRRHRKALFHREQTVVMQRSDHHRRPQGPPRGLQVFG